MTTDRIIESIFNIKAILNKITDGLLEPTIPPDTKLEKLNRVQLKKMSVCELLNVYVHIGRDAGSNGQHLIPSNEDLAFLEFTLRAAVTREVQYGEA